MTSTVSEESKPRKTAIISAGITLLLFGGFYMYILLRIDTSLSYYLQNPVFITTFDYFRSFLDTPGGVGVYSKD